MADVFAARGYRVTRNAHVVGASGARYEVDVLAERDGDLVPQRVAVECKNLAAPIDTQVVGRLRMLLDDTRIGTGVIVAPGGDTPAVRAAAHDAGIAVWRRDELHRLVGDAALAGLAPRPAPTADAVPRARPVDACHRALRMQAGGALGLARGHRGAWSAWLALHELTVGETTARGRRGRHQAQTVHPVFEAVTGTLVGIHDAPLATEPVAVDAPVLPVCVAASVPAAAVADAVARRDRAVQPATRDRHRDALAALGVDPDAVDAVVEATRTVLVPVTVALVTRRGASHAVVLDDVSGRLDPALGDALTARLGDVAACLGDDPRRTAQG